MKMGLGEKSSIKPHLIKIGVALAFSFAGFLFSRFRTRRIKPSLPPPRSPRSSDSGEKARRKDELAKQPKPGSHYGVPVAPEKYEEVYMQKFGDENSVVGFSPSIKRSGEKDGLLLPEFNDLVKEFDSAAANAGFSPTEDVDSASSDIETPKVFVRGERGENEQEISHLRNMVKILRERERHLEVQLLEYYGLKEQETAVMELQNRLKINNMEAKLFHLKIDSLEAKNHRLEEQVAAHAKVVAELEAARAKINLLKKKFRFEAEQNKEQILNLRKRVEKMQDQEFKSVVGDPEIQLKLKRLKDLEGESEDLRKSNIKLQLENADLSRRLESTQILANSVLEDPQTNAPMEENDRLRQENEDLQKEIEQLQAGRCSDIEELVYLRWINACLRYELRNYQPAAGETAARDLSKTLSPKSEEKAKQLIMQYANTKGIGEKEISLLDFDYEQWSSSQSSLTDSTELDESCLDTSSAAKTNSSSKNKFFNKLRKLVHGKDNHHDNHVLSADKSGFIEDSNSPSCSSTIAETNKFGTSSRVSSRASLDLPRLRNLKEGETKDIKRVHRHRHSDLGSYHGYKRFVLGAEGDTDSTLKDDNDPADNSALVKYAEALKSSRSEFYKLHRKSASYSSF